MSIPDFAIMTACDREYLKKLEMTVPTWSVKEQWRSRHLYLFIHGLRERSVEWVRKYFPNLTVVKWEMPNAQTHREEMLSAFVLGAAKHITEDYYLKLDADAYAKDSQDVFEEDDFNHVLCAHPWGYTKPAWWAHKMRAWCNGQGYKGREEGSVGATRIISWCCMHQMQFVRQAASCAGDRLPIPSHDSYLWHLAEAFSLPVKRKSMKERGVDHQSKLRSLRDDICSWPGVWNDRWNEILLSKIQIEITSACNLTCANCDRNCGTAPRPEERMTEDQIVKFIRESDLLNKKWRRIDVIGGEPTIHPDRSMIYRMIDEHRTFDKDCEIRITTNGILADRIKEIPKAWTIRNSAKEKDGCQKFDAVNMAPIDDGHADPIRACSIPWRCGIALTRYGFFPCGAGASIARIFGLDIGIRCLKDVTPDALRNQLGQLCRYCGHSRTACRQTDKQMTSKSWKAAFTSYKDKSMTIY